MNRRRTTEFLLVLPTVGFVLIGSSCTKSTTESKPSTDSVKVETESTVSASEPESSIDLGLSPAQNEAREAALSYLATSSFSEQGLIDQLSSEYADQYALEDAQAAVATLEVDWLAEAVEAAESYLELSGFSEQGLIDQLSSDFADKFPIDQATSAVESLSVDWNAEAAESAKSYVELMSYSCQELIDQLTSEYADKYTLEQATYGAGQTGIC
jgi:uncharacterized protein (DUF2249 family)